MSRIRADMIELVVILPTGDQLLRLRGTSRAWWYVAPRKPATPPAPVEAPAPVPPAAIAVGGNVVRFPNSKEQ
jgi:hypothetical protein